MSTAANSSLLSLFVDVRQLTSCVRLLVSSGEHHGERDALLQTRVEDDMVPLRDAFRRQIQPAQRVASKAVGARVVQHQLRGWEIGIRFTRKGQAMVVPAESG